MHPRPRTGDYPPASPLRIVDVSESYSPQGGGVRTYVHAKLRAAAALGHDVTIVAPGTSDEEQTVPGGRILRIKSPRSPFDARYGVFVSPRPVHAAMLALQPDLVEGSSPWLGGHIAGTYPGDAKRVMVFHTDPVAVWAQTLLSPRLGFGSVDRLMMPAWQAFRRMSAKFDGTVVSGLWLARRLLSQGFRRPLVVPFGIDKSRFDAAARSEDMRTELLAACGLGPDAQLVAVVGRLDPEKRIGTLIRAFDRARRHRPMGLVIFGRGALAPIYGAMAKRVPGVHMAGFVDTPERMSTALASADAFLHGGAAETYGMAVAESICAGVPVVVPDVGGANALYGAPWGERYKAGDPDAAAAALLRLLDRDPVALRQACAGKAAAIPSIEQHFENLFEVYGALCAEARSNQATPRLRVAS